MDIFRRRPLCVLIAVFMSVSALLLQMPLALKAAAGGACAAAGILIMVFKRRFVLPAGMLCALAAACLVSAVYFNVIVAGDTAYIGTQGRIEAEITNITYRADFATYADVTVKSINGDKVSIKAKLECAYMLECEPRDTVALDADICDFDTADDAFNEKRFYNSKGFYIRCVSDEPSYDIAGRAPLTPRSFFASVNRWCDGVLRDSLSPQAYGLCSAVLLGNRGELEPSLKRDFSQIGISHMLAVSGLHLSVLMGGIYAILCRLGIHKKRVILITIVLCLFYMGLTGAPPSVVRSGIMYICMGAALLFAAESDSVTALFLAGGIITLVSPGSILDAGFLLSFFATLGIVTVAPPVGKMLEPLKAKGWFGQTAAALAGSFIVTGAAVLFTLPLNAYYFGRMYVLILVTNLLFSPFISLLLFAAPFVIPLSFIPFVGSGYAYAVNSLCGLISHLVSKIAALDIGSIPLNYPFVKWIIAAFTAALIALVLLRVRNPMWGFAVLGVCAGAYIICRAVFLADFNSYAYAACINNGKNDVLTLHSGDTTAVIDVSTGGRANAVLGMDAAFDRFYDMNVECFVLTHYHKYNIATLNRITDTYYIDRVAAPYPCSEDEKAIADELAKLLGEKGIAFSVYHEGGFDLYGEMNIIPRRDFINRSTHPVISIDVGFEGGELVYLGSSWSETTAIKVGTDCIYFGAHGPKQKEPSSLVPVCNTAVYANGDVRELNEAESVNEIVTEDGGETTVLRISG